MKILLLADLHGNMPATLAMEKAMEQLRPDTTWFLGDAVGKGPDNAATCDWVRARCQHFVGGNWDYGLGLKEFPADEFYWNQLGPERMQWLAQLPREGEFTLAGRRFRVFHGRPVTPLLQANEPNDILEATFTTESGVYGGVIFADSHRPFIRSLHTGYIMNTGSVGNSIGVPCAHALLLEGGMEAESPLLMTILSLPYDNEAAAQRARQFPDLPFQASYIREVTTGIYSR